MCIRDREEIIVNLEQRLMEMEVGPLFGLFIQSVLMQIISWLLTISIFVIVYGRMIEIYLVTSLAPVPIRADPTSQASLVRCRETTILTQTNQRQRSFFFSICCPFSFSSMPSIRSTLARTVSNCRISCCA